MTTSSSKPLVGKASDGWRTELSAAMAQPELAQVESDGEPARRAAYWLAVVLGHCRLQGIDLGEQDGSLPAPIALPAGRRLAQILVRRKEAAQGLEDRLARARGEVEANDLCFDLLESRMEAWAAFVAIDEAYQVSLEDRWPQQQAFAELMDELLERSEELDRQMNGQIDLLALVATYPLLENWKRSLAPEYQQILPWWLDGRLQKFAKDLTDSQP